MHYEGLKENVRYNIVYTTEDGSVFYKNGTLDDLESEAVNFIFTTDGILVGIFYHRIIQLHTIRVFYSDYLREVTGDGGTAAVIERFEK